MNPLALLPFLLGIALAGSVVAIGIWAQVPSSGVVVIGLVAASSMAAGATRKPRFVHWCVLGIAWAGTILLVGSRFFEGGFFTADSMYSVIAWLLAATVLFRAQAAEAGLRTGWRVLGVTWGLVGIAIWLAFSYAQNLAITFHLGLLFALVLVLACKALFRLPAIGTYTANTVILLLIGLPVADLAVRLSTQTPRAPKPSDKVYLYDRSRSDPAGFERWCDEIYWQWRSLAKDILEPDPAMQYRLKPNSRGRYFDSAIRINNKGFRGNDLPDEKGNAYRIVALGESTTFGMTLTSDARPWPELLEAMIRERLKPSRPIQVINAGVPGYSLENNLYRFQADILPLKPDLVISYHGYNGFYLISRGLPMVCVRNPPAYHRRPLALLAASEYRIRLLWYNHSEERRAKRNPPVFSTPLDTDYARKYRELIQLTKTNGVRLALANFSMAVNDRSDLDVIQFYHRTVATVTWRIKANEVHSAIVKQLTREDPSLCFVDTQPHLDGDYSKFVDIVHLTQEGRQQLAENIFAGVKELLEEELSSTNGSARNRNP